MTAVSLPWDGLGKAATAAARPEVSRVSEAANDDRERIVRAQRGDEEAFRELVEKYKKRAYWVAYNLVGDENDARDIAQEAFIRVFRSISRFDLRYKFYTWLYQIVTNLSIDTLRKRQNQRRLSLDDVGDVRAGGPSAHERLERLELRERVRIVLEELPPKYRAVIALREIEGLSSKEIADIVGSTHATVRWRLHRARSLFRTAWEARFGKMEGALPAKTHVDDEASGGEEADHEV